jgi:hypothetical protein
MNATSTVVGMVAGILAILGFVPLLGYLNWVALFLTILGITLGLYAVKSTGITVNFVVLVVAVLRLLMGGGIV